jgi:hypothetical protein
MEFLSLEICVGLSLEICAVLPLFLRPYIAGAGGIPTHQNPNIYQTYKRTPNFDCDEQPEGTRLHKKGSINDFHRVVSFYVRGLRFTATCSRIRKIPDLWLSCRPRIFRKHPSRPSN